MIKNQNTLQGLRVLNTRPAEQNKTLSYAIQNAGGISIELPTIVIEPLRPDWLKTLPDLSDVDHAVFVSANAIKYYFLAAKQLVWPSSITVTAIGQASADELTTRGIPIHHTPIDADSEHLLRLDHLQQIQNQTVMLIKGEKGRPLIEKTLRSRGADVIPVAVYRRELPKTNSLQTNLLWHDNAVDIILFTSQQSMYNLFTLFGEKARDWLCSKPCLVISERLAESASQLGMQTIIVCRHHSLLNTLEQYIKGRTNDKQP